MAWPERREERRKDLAAERHPDASDDEPCAVRSRTSKSFPLPESARNERGSCRREGAGRDETLAVRTRPLRALRSRLRPGRRLTQLAGRAGWHLVRQRDFDVLPRNYYSPVPDLSAIPETVWARRSPLRGIDLDADRSFVFAEAHLSPYIAEWCPPLDGRLDEPTFFLRNHTFQDVDAELLYAMVRHAKPHRIVELGSGFSTLVMAEAVVANARDGEIGTLVSYDPHPRPNVAEFTIPGLGEQHALRAQDVPSEVFAALGPGDILFVDTTHTVKLDGDVNRIVLDVLPTLRPGVLVHFHDVWLPWEYHRHLLITLGYYWSEQYLLQAFLAENRGYEVVLPLQAMIRHDAKRMARLVPRYEPEHHPSGFWIRRVEVDVSA